MPHPRRPSRRALLRTLAAGVAIPAGVGFYTWQVEPFWPEFHERPMPIAGLPAGLAGARVAHLTDLHVASPTSYAYVRGVVRQVNALRPDLVLVTGDLVTHGQTGWLDRACDLVAQLKPAVFVSFGNHDYGREALPGGGEVDVAAHLEARLTRAGHTVLRNRAATWGRGGQTLRIVGMEDLWSGRFAPATAFSDGEPADTARPTIALSHNPDTGVVVDGYRPAWILAGHTHGGQIRIPGYGALLLPIQQRHLQKGEFQLAHARLYVSRGVGFLTRTRFCCRPEVPIFTLQPA
ncbi:MAG TPA: metallophosphoesterase [Tepidisphaeraceae bacterium]|nr:metallophosphoesterase [Tepidisphaeraceae bacterium]